MASIDKRLGNLEAALSETVEVEEWTPEEKRIDFIWELYLSTMYHLKDYLPDETQSKLLGEWQYIHNYPHLEKPEDLTDAEQELFSDLAWYSRLYLTAFSAMIETGIHEGEVYPGMVEDIRARITELEETDTPDLARTDANYYPTPSWQDMIEMQRKAGISVYGPKPGCTDDQSAGKTLAIEYYWQGDVKRWIRMYGAEIVNEFIPLDKYNISVEEV